MKRPPGTSWIGPVALPEEVALQFRGACALQGIGQAEMIETLIRDWLGMGKKKIFLDKRRKRG